MKRDNPEADIVEILDRMLGEQISTKETYPELTFTEEMDNHEIEFRTWKGEQDKKNLLKKEEAKEIGRDINEEVQTPEATPKEESSTDGPQ